MGFQFNMDVGTVNPLQPPTFNSTTASEILAHGPYYTVTNPYYSWNGSELSSASDADFNIFMAYYIADKLSDTPGWHNADDNTTITDTTSLAYYATGKDVTWSHMKQNIARSINENTGGIGYNLYQNTSGNVLMKNYTRADNTNPNPNRMTTIGLGHDTDPNYTAVHLDYTDLRAYQLLNVEQG